MHENKAIAIEISNQGIRSVASEANGLAYFVSDNDTRVAVAGTKGITILTKEQIFDRIWGFDSDTMVSVVEVYVSNLRKALKKD